MATLGKLKPGQVLYDVHSHRMGNTTMKTVGVWPVRIIEVYEDHVVASWNGNPPRKFYQYELTKLRLKEPVLIDTGMMGRKRLATREELKAIKG